MRRKIPSFDTVQDQGHVQCPKEGGSRFRNNSEGQVPGLDVQFCDGGVMGRTRHELGSLEA